GRLAPADALDRAPEGGQDLRRQGIPAERRCARGLEPERGTDDRGAAPGALGILRRHDEAEPDLEPPRILEDQAREATRQRRTQARERGIGWRPGGRGELRKGRETVIARDPQHGGPPVVGGAGRPAHADLVAMLADPQLLLAQVRRAGRGRSRAQLVPDSAGFASSGGSSLLAAAAAALASSSASIAASSSLSISRRTSGEGGSILP